MSKRKLKFHSMIHILPVAAFSVLMAAILLYGNTRMISDYNEQEAARTAMLVGVIRDRNPEMTDTEIVRYLKAGEGSSDLKEKGDEILKKYGYDMGYFSKGRDDLIRKLLLMNLSVLFIFGSGSVIFYFRFKKRVRNEVADLETYFRQLNKGNYELMIGQSEEGELSLLRSDIFKITQLLKTAAENSQEQNESMSRWLADISHQLKTPIASIRIDLDNMMDDPDMPPEIRRQFIKECSIQLEWISSLVQTLLKLARIDAGTVELKKEEMDLLQVALEAQKKLSILSEISGVDVVWETEPKGDIVDPESLSPTVMTGDASWQLEAISNIIKNCLEHSTAGSKVYLSLRNTTVFKELTVRDEGEGISETDLPHIFERFYRAENAKRESVGIGLSLASSIVEAGGGKIMVRSERGKGTSFVIRYLT